MPENTYTDDWSFGVMSVCVKKPIGGVSNVGRGLVMIDRAALHAHHKNRDRREQQSLKI